MFVTLPKSTEVREGQLEKAPLPMLVTLPSSTEVRDGQSSKALFANESTILGIVMCPKASFVEHVRPESGEESLTYFHWVKNPPSFLVMVVEPMFLTARLHWQNFVKNSKWQQN